MGTLYKGTKKEQLALDAYIKLMRATESVTVRINRHAVNPVLTISQFGVLEALLHLGPLCQRDLAQKILKSSGNITMVIDNLEKGGFVRRERGADRRFLTVHLTVTGRELIDSLFPRHVRAVCDELAVLTADEQRELARICRKLGLAGRQD
jgi:MarR family 2-MHQ and catechol resistance regulon transcriptional repressor